MIRHPNSAVTPSNGQEGGPLNIRLPVWLGYVAAIAMEAAVTGILLFIHPYLPLAQFPIAYVLVIMLVAYLFGPGPALLAFVLGFFAFDYFFVPPLHIVFPKAETPLGWAGMIAYLLGASIVAAATIMMRNSKHRIERIADDLRESEERSRLLVSGVKDYAIFYVDADGFITSWNEGAERIKGYKAEEIIGKHVSVYYTPEDIVAGRPELALAAARREGRHEEEAVRVRKDGSTFWANVLTTALYDQAGSLRGYAKITRDVTERKQAEEAISQALEDLTTRSTELDEANEKLQLINEELESQNEELHLEVEERRKAEEALLLARAEAEQRASELQAVLDIAPVAVWIAHDPECLQITGNRYADEIIMQVPRGANISASARPGRAAVTFRVFRGSVELEPDELPSQVAAATGKPVAPYVLDLVFSDGRVVTLLEGAVPLFDAEGRVRGSVAAAADVTELKSSEDALRESVRLLDAVIDGSPSPIFLKDREGKFITINAALERMLGMSREELRGKTDYDIAPKEVADYWGAHDKEVIATGAAIQIEELADLEDGHHVFLANKFPLVDADGQVYGVGAISHDITERKVAEEALSNALHDLTVRSGELDAANAELQAMNAEMGASNDALNAEVEQRKIAEETLKNQLLSLQRALLPAKPSVGPGFKTASAYIPAYAGEEIGGDFYDIFRIEDGKVAILIGDVSGKGIEAASFGVATRNTVRAFAYEIPSTAEALTHANKVLARQQSGHFVTLFLAVLDPVTGDFRYSSGGHPPPIVYRGNGDIEALDFGDIPVGVMENYDYRETQSHMEPGDRLILYTDGVTESRKEADLFGFEGLKCVLLGHPEDDADALVGNILAAASAWADGRLRDDTAIIVIERIKH